MSMNGFLKGATAGAQAGFQMYEANPAMVGQDTVDPNAVVSPIDGSMIDPNTGNPATVTPATADHPGKGASAAANAAAYQRAGITRMANLDKTSAANQPPGAYLGPVPGFTGMNGASGDMYGTGAVPAPVPVTATQLYAKGGLVQHCDDGGAIEDPDQVSAPQAAPASVQQQALPAPAPAPAPAIPSPQNGAPIDPNTGDPATLQQQALAEPDANNQEPPQSDAPQQGAPPPQTVLQHAASEAIHYNQDYYGLHNVPPPAAVGGQPAPEQQNFADRKDMDGQGKMALAPTDLQSVWKAIDPNDQLSQGQRSMLGLQQSYQWYRDHGQPEQASRFAAMYVNASVDLSRQLGAQAQTLLKQGDPGGAVQKLIQAYGTVPNGKDAAVTKDANGQPVIALTDNTGKPVGTFPLNPATLMNMANRTASGTMAWNQMIDAAQGGNATGFVKGVLDQRAAQAKLDNAPDKSIPAFDPSQAIPVGGAPAPAVPAPSAGTQQPTPPPAPPPPASPPQGGVVAAPDHVPAQTPVPNASPAIPTGVPTSQPVTPAGNGYVGNNGENFPEAPPLPDQYQASPQQTSAASAAGPQAVARLDAEIRNMNALSAQKYIAQKAQYDALVKEHSLKSQEISDPEKFQAAASDSTDAITKAFPDPTKTTDAANPVLFGADAGASGDAYSKIFTTPVKGAITQAATDVARNNATLRSADAATKAVASMLLVNPAHPEAQAFTALGRTPDNKGIRVRAADGSVYDFSHNGYVALTQAHTRIAQAYAQAYAQAPQPGTGAVGQGVDLISRGAHPMAKDITNALGTIKAGIGAIGSSLPTKVAPVPEDYYTTPAIQ